MESDVSFWDTLPAFIIAAFFVWWQWYETREAERRRTAPARARRATQNLTIDALTAWAIAGSRQSEAILRRMLLDDLRQVLAQRQAKELLREHYGLEL